MRRIRPRSIAVFLVFHLSSAGFAAGGSVVPTWIEQVETTYSYNGSPTPMTTVTAYPVTGPHFVVANFFDPRDPFSGSTTVGLVDYARGAGPVSLGILDAKADGLVSLPGASVSLDVYSLPASATPPPPGSIPTGTYLTTLEIPVGDYHSSPYEVTLPGDGCYLLATDTSAYGPSSLTLTAAVVPEPPSWLPLAGGIGIVAVAGRRWRRRPG